MDTCQKWGTHQTHDVCCNSGVVQNLLILALLLLPLLLPEIFVQRSQYALAEDDLHNFPRTNISTDTPVLVSISMIDTICCQTNRPRPPPSSLRASELVRPVLSAFGKPTLEKWLGKINILQADDAYSRVWHFPYGKFHNHHLIILVNLIVPSLAEGGPVRPATQPDADAIVEFHR